MSQFAGHLVCNEAAEKRRLQSLAFIDGQSKEK